ncbi:MAG: hypothetical protein QOD99_2433, partial [Chthoniobacter sp.]|nr:hypothetical protein [Chthoniobacter sp.]
MKFPRSGHLCRAASLLLLAAPQLHALDATGWRHRQILDIPAAGLTRAELPTETLDAARSALEDLRITDPAGNEVPFTIERPMPQPESTRRAKSFRSALGDEATAITIETGTIEPLAGVSLEMPATQFIKAARVEASHDGENWQELSAGQPLFRTPQGAEKLRADFPRGAWEFLRITLDDRRLPAIPITGIRLLAAKSDAPVEPFTVTIKSRDENPNVTRLALDLGATNITLASLHIETPEPLFTRTVSLAAPEVSEEGITERPLGESVIYRVGVEGKSEARIDVPLEKQIHARELLVFIHNGDSPPLQISAVRGERRMVRLIFYAGGPGSYVLLSGNSECAAPRYDVSALGSQLQGASAQDVKPSSLAENPGYKAPEALGALALTGAAIDTGDWKFRKTIQLARTGAQQLELDLDILAHAAGGLRDLRIVSDGRQLPFLVEHTSISRPIALSATLVTEPKRPTLSRWSLKLPRVGLPITRVVCVSSSPLFQRDVRLWEEAADARGDKFPRELGRATWKQTPDRTTHELALELNTPPLTDTLLVETDNGDNPAIDLRDFRSFYPATRVVFKTSPEAAKPLWLYFGRRDASAPRYDLGLVAEQLLRATKSNASLGA